MPKQPLPFPGIQSPQPVLIVERLLERARHFCISGKLTDAIAIYRQILAMDPLNTDALVNSGNALAKNQQFAAALRQYENALRINPDLSEAWINMGNVLADIGLMQRALESYERVNELLPQHLLGYFYRAAVLFRMGRFTEAAAVYEVAESYAPGDPAIKVNRGTALCWAGHPEQAMLEFNRAIAHEPDNVEAFINRGMQRLLYGDLPGGHEDFEWRWKRRDLMQFDRLDYPQPRWLGDGDLTGKTILLWNEQGLGDTLQYCRYAILAAQAGARVILDIPKSLARLMKTVPNVSDFVVSGEQPPDFDLHCPLMSLPLAFRTTVETIPAFDRYLSADPYQIEDWRIRLAGLSGVKIGLVWAGSSRMGQADLVATDQRRSMMLNTLAPLSRVETCEFVSLQLGPPAKQTATPPAGMVLHDFTEHLKDFADTAALVENLDLVIAVDTSVAHVAGALGKPVWLLNRFDTCWRWLLDREDTPWYPTMRIFRQTSPGDWDGVVARVADALRGFVAG